MPAGPRLSLVYSVSPVGSTLKVVAPLVLFLLIYILILASFEASRGHPFLESDVGVQLTPSVLGADANEFIPLSRALKVSIIWPTADVFKLRSTVSAAHQLVLRLEAPALVPLVFPRSSSSLQLEAPPQCCSMTLAITSSILHSNTPIFVPTRSTLRFEALLFVPSSGLSESPHPSKKVPRVPRLL